MFFLVLCVLLVLFLPNKSLDYLAIVIVGISCIFVVIQVFCDYKTWIIIDEQGISMFRRGRKFSLRWEDIKRLEYSGVRWCRIFDVLLIHTSNETLYIEHTFNDYDTIWAMLQERLSRAVPSAIIDNNLPLR